MDPSSGRGRGGAAKIARIEANDDDDQDEVPRPRDTIAAEPTTSAEPVQRQSSGSSDEERPTRGRAGYRRMQSAEIITIPDTCRSVQAVPERSSRECEVYANYVRVVPMKHKDIFQYRFDCEPQIDSTALRRMLMATAFREILESGYTFDGVNDARSTFDTPNKVNVKKVPHPDKADLEITCTLKQVGTVNWSSFEMMRLYNFHAKDLLRALGYYPISNLGAYVNPDITYPVGNQNDLSIIRGFKCVVAPHVNDTILMQLEPVHKVLQTKSVLDIMCQIRSRVRGNFQESVKNELIGKLVVTSYVKRVYKIEDVNFTVNPMTTFPDTKKGVDVTYLDYYATRYGATINDKKQPLLLATPNSKKKNRGLEEEKERDIYLIPELCNIAGLTDAQRVDSKVKFDMIRASQVSPQQKVEAEMDFLMRLSNRKACVEKLERWGYSYEPEPVKIKARTLGLESICLANNVGKEASTWPKIDNQASFDCAVLRDKLAVAPNFQNMAVFVPRPLAECQDEILSKLRSAFQKIGLEPKNVKVIKMVAGDSPHNYVNYLKELPPGVTAALILFPAQNKEKYDAVKKIAACELGIVTQCMLGKLLMDPRKASGAALKIGIQVAAKIGGEPWHLKIPLTNCMVCGYDTYHDTANRGRSFGAFVASMNDKYSKWFSRADAHDRVAEMTSHLTDNLVAAIRRYNVLNGKFPDRVFIYRDGVSDGELEHISKVEIAQVIGGLKVIDHPIKLTIIVVNKRVGSRFYLKVGQNKFVNCPPGTVIDDVVTRRGRYDFHLISQSTRAGTVSPTYYNIVYDDSGLQAAHHQAMAYKFCFLYYNWTGSVRVPAPCQYAHKLAQLCGEHLHATPSQNLDDRLHFL